MGFKRLLTYSLHSSKVTKDGVTMPGRYKTEQLALSADGAAGIAEPRFPPSSALVTPWLITGGVLSFLLHGVVLFVAGGAWPRFVHQPPVIDIQFIPATEDQKQIVRLSPLEDSTEAVPISSRVSDKNSRTQNEQVRRGDSFDAGTPEERSSLNIRQQAIHPPLKEKAPGLESTSPPPLPAPKIQSLRLAEETLQDAFGQKSETPRAKQPNPRARELLSGISTEKALQVVPFSRPTGSGAKIFGDFGSNDFLPDLPDGDITLLNAKASKFAVFVQRVATRVFSALRASGWEALSPSHIRSIRDFSTIRAILSPEGQLISVLLEAPSGSQPFDEVLKISVWDGASDPHPPEGAKAPDGNIHFIFKARSWSQVAPSRGGTGVSERRWLLLATGLD
jgi:hypothetical protein